MLEGAWRAGMPSGKGTQVLRDGSRFEGTFSQGMWHGEGYRTMTDGRIFHGRFDRGVLRTGVLRYPSGAMYKVGGEQASVVPQLTRPFRVCVAVCGL